MMNYNKLHFNTIAAANLFKTEITGQLSDGMWENARPLNHWEYWNDAEVVVDGKIGHEGYPIKTNYNLGSLKKYVKEDMMNAIRITKMPWFDESWMDYTRTLTNKAYLEFLPFNLKKQVTKYTPEYVKAHYGATIESKLNDVTRMIGENVSPEFVKKIEDEIINQMILKEDGYVQSFNKNVEKNWQKLNTIGVVDEDSYHKMIKEINNVEVTDEELNEALNEIKAMMTTKA